MDPANTPLGRMLLDEISPVVMVLTTPLVEESCQKNGLSFIEMLRPFCVFNNIDVPVRTASDQPYRLQKFKLRLFYASDIRQPDLQVAKERLKEVITQAGEEERLDLHLDAPQADDLLSRSESEVLPSWFNFFNKELIRTSSFSDHEAFDHPVACLLVVSSKDEQPINRFVDLLNTNQLPSLLNDGAMDPKLLKLYLLVHDNQDSAPENATTFLSEMKSTFGANASQLLYINSSGEGLVEHLQNPWIFSPKNDASSSQRLGRFLNKDDVNEIKDLTQDMASKHIIPYMEEKVRVLNQQVSATRKGFRNQIKNLWWRKGREDSLEASNGPMYTFSSIESQIRVLGDYAFMLRDYELALSNYRLISTDYKLDKAWKRYAGVQEMMGVAYFMLNHSRKEEEHCMENAFNTYLKNVAAGHQNAVRCGLWWIEMLKARDQFKEAAGVYFLISGEESLHSAVMLEQASYCYLYSKPPMLRKYGFHLVLSGNQYKKSDQIKHAIRTYRRAISVFKGTTWSYIKDHVHFHIGQWYAFLGLYDAAIIHMLEVLMCAHQSKTTQELFLKNFLHFVQKTGRACELLKLPLPIVNASSLKVVFQDHRTYASSAAIGVRESLWRSLEEEVIPSLPTARTNWLEVQSKFISRQHKESNICIVGEAIEVDVEFKNPLQISIPLTKVSLICELSERSEEAETDAKTSSELQNDQDINLTDERPVNSDYSSVALSDVECVLEGGSTTMVKLTVTPREEGILKIVGVKWKLSGSVSGCYNFITSPLKKMATKKRKQKRSSTDNLKFVVIKSLPKLEGLIHSLPEKVYAGELRHLTLELSNKSEVAVKNLKMKISHPRFLNVGNVEHLDIKYPACLQKRAYGEQTGPMSQPREETGPRSQPRKGSQSVFLFPNDIVIQRDSPLSWPLWLHAAVPGNISLYIVLYYEIEDAESSIKYRTLRMFYNMEVLPSIDVSFKINPQPSTLQKFLVRMDVSNRTSEDFQIDQLSSLGSQWEISLIDPLFHPPLLMSAQAFSCFLMLKRHEKSVDSEEVSSLFPTIGSDVKLSTKDDGESLYDISLSPLSDFHNCERLHQERPSQGESDTADFILISRRVESENSPGVSHSPCLLSNHACHCSISSSSPISWVIDGPREMHHKFSASFCEVSLKMTLYNSSDAVASVRVNTLDSNLVPDSSAVLSPDREGWYNVSLESEIKVVSDVRGTILKSLSSESVRPIIWSGSSSTKLQLEPASTAEISLQVCIFSPGTYDLSNYVVQWNLQPSFDQESEETRPTSGTCPGYPYYLTVLPSL